MTCHHLTQSALLLSPPSTQSVVVNPVSPWPHLSLGFCAFDVSFNSSNFEHGIDFIAAILPLALVVLTFSSVSHVFEGVLPSCPLQPPGLAFALLVLSWFLQKI